jgi:hypothetical protein
MCCITSNVNLTQCKWNIITTLTKHLLITLYQGRKKEMSIVKMARTKTGSAGSAVWPTSHAWRQDTTSRPRHHNALSIFPITRPPNIFTITNSLQIQSPSHLIKATTPPNPTNPSQRQNGRGQRNSHSVRPPLYFPLLLPYLGSRLFSVFPSLNFSSPFLTQRSLPSLLIPLCVPPFLVIPLTAPI